MSAKSDVAIEQVTVAIMRGVFNAYYVGVYDNTKSMFTANTAPIDELNNFLGVLADNGFTLGTDAASMPLADKHGLYWFKRMPAAKAAQTSTKMQLKSSIGDRKAG